LHFVAVVIFYHLKNYFIVIKNILINVLSPGCCLIRGHFPRWPWFRWVLQMALSRNLCGCWSRLPRLCALPDSSWTNCVKTQKGL